MKNFIEPKMEIIMFKDCEITTGTDGNIVINPWGGYDSSEESDMFGGY